MPHLRKIGVEIIKNASTVIFLSKSYRDEVIEKYIPKEMKKLVFNKSLIIPNGIDDFWFRNIGTGKKKLDNSNIKLLQVGNVDKNKNVIITLRAIDFLRQKGLNVQLDVVGRIKNKRIFSQIKKVEYVNYLGFLGKR